MRELFALMKPEWKWRAQLAHKVVIFVWSFAIRLVHLFADLFGGNRSRTVIFGSALVQNQSPNEKAHTIGVACAGMGVDIVHGGGSGTMQDATIGARFYHGGNVNHEQMTYTIGLPMNLPDIEAQEQGNSLYLWVHDFFLRLLHFLTWGNCFVAVEGGFGTLLEVATVMQMLQKHRLAIKKGKLKQFRFLLNPATRMGFEPSLILVNDKGFYDPFLKQIEAMAAQGLLNPDDESILKVAHSVEEAIELIRQNHERFLAFCEKHNLPLKCGSAQTC